MRERRTPIESDLTVRALISGVLLDGQEATGRAPVGLTQVAPMESDQVVSVTTVRDGHALANQSGMTHHDTMTPPLMRMSRRKNWIERPFANSLRSPKKMPNGLPGIW